jgi:hypothetical protein
MNRLSSNRLLIFILASFFIVANVFITPKLFHGIVDRYTVLSSASNDSKLLLLSQQSLQESILKQQKEPFITDDEFAVFNRVERKGVIADNISIYDTDMPFTGYPSLSDYLEIYYSAQIRLEEAVRFRVCELQPHTDDQGFSCDGEASLANYYEDFNEQSLQDRFCCAGEDNYLNRLIEARNLFAVLYLVEPQALSFQLWNQTIVFKEVGRKGLLDTTHEMALAQMIFASEYAIDALDYRFTIEGLAGGNCRDRIDDAMTRPLRLEDTTTQPYDYSQDAVCIINNELALLQEAEKYYQNVIDLMVAGFSFDLAWPQELYVGQLFTATEIDVFARALENYALVLDEMAQRHRQLQTAVKNDQSARQLYTNFLATTFSDSTTLPFWVQVKHVWQMSADDQVKNSLQARVTTFWSNKEFLQARIQAIDTGMDLLGYTADFVPIQSYADMKAAAKEMLAWAIEANNAARVTTRDWEMNGDAYEQEYLNIATTYLPRLQELCGESDKDYQTCEGGIGSKMDQNWLDQANAALHISLAQLAITHTLQTISDTIALADGEILVKTSTSHSITLNSLAEGIVRAQRVTTVTTSSTSNEVFRTETDSQQTVRKEGLFDQLSGNDALGLSAASGGLGPLIGNGIDDLGGQTLEKYLSTLGPAIDLAGVALEVPGLGGLLGSFFGSTQRTQIHDISSGTRHSEMTTSATSTVFDPAEIEIARLENENQLAQLAQEVEIIGARSEADVRALLRSLAEQQIDIKVYSLQLQRAVNEQQALIREWRMWSDLYARAIDIHNSSYIANPAWRLLRDHDTEVATAQLEMAKQQAYLAAKALEYQILDEIPFIHEVFKVRDVNQLQAYLTKLDSVARLTGEINEYTRLVSLRAVVSNITEEDLNSLAPGSAEYNQLQAERENRFRQYLEQHLITDNDGKPIKLLLKFSTSLLEGPFADSGVYNWRIQGAHTGSTDSINVDKCPYRRSDGVMVTISEGGQTLPEYTTVRLTQAGYLSYRKSDGSIAVYTPRLATPLSNKDIPESILAQLRATSISAMIEVNSTENTISNFCNRSVAASEWVLELDLTNGVDWKELEDIAITFKTFAYTRPGH